MAKIPVTVSQEAFGKVVHLLEQEDCCGTIEVGIFTCDAGKSLERHDHGECAEWCYILDGEAVFDIDGEKTEVREGEMILLPGESRHLSYSGRADRGFTSVYIVARKNA